MHPLGSTRTVVKRNHAFIAPDGHVQAPLPGWTRTQGIILITPRMMDAPEFTMYLALMEDGAKSAMPLPTIQRFIYVQEGEISLLETTVSVGEYAYLPADTPHEITSAGDSRLIIFEKPYLAPDHGGEEPHFLTGNAWEAKGDPFMGDPNAFLRTLLPTDEGWDMGVNLFTFQPGTPLPFVETHIMEHGLYLLEGQGIYRLDNDWYPIQAGDVIWMGPYCPQWFAAIGTTQSTYLYYKDINRDPFR